MTQDPPSTEHDTDEVFLDEIRSAARDASSVPYGTAVPIDAKSHTNVNVPKRIGPYYIKRVLATGGMGTVYEGNQENPSRAVAVKVMRQGVVARSALRRFEFEAQVPHRQPHQSRSPQRLPHSSRCFDVSV